MSRLSIATAVLTAAIGFAPLPAAAAAATAAAASTATIAPTAAGAPPAATQVQHRRGDRGRSHPSARGFRPDARGYRPHARPYRPYARPYYAPGPRWAYRPWYRRPYYGSIIAGVALGTIVGVTAYGLAPQPPRPDLCWFWADEDMASGYWDYCPGD